MKQGLDCDHENRLLNFSPRLADEPGIVTVVEEEVADETSGGSDLDPTSSRASITLVDALPGELSDR